MALTPPASWRGFLKCAASHSRMAPRMTLLRTCAYSTSTIAGNAGVDGAASERTRRVALILASSRSPCNGAGIAAWLKPLLHHHLAPIPHTLDVITPNTPPLPLGSVVDGTFLPSQIKDPALYSSAAVRQWSTFVSSTDLFVFLTPEYNSGFPGELKNTLDHIYWEWCNKPAMIVAYGGGGGLRATAMLSGILKVLRMRVVEKSVNIQLPMQYSAGDQKVPLSGPFPDFLEAQKAQVHAAVDEAKALLL